MRPITARGFTAICERSSGPARQSRLFDIERIFRIHRLSARGEGRGGEDGRSALAEWWWSSGRPHPCPLPLAGEGGI